MNEQQARPNRKGKKSITSVIAMIIIAIFAYFYTFDEEAKTPQSGEQIPVELVRTIDGDTIKVIYKGEEVNIRYLLIDTPEINHQDSSKTEPFARAATNRNDELLKSGDVTIEFDVGDQEDEYGRLLAYIYVDGKSVQKTLLKEGYARVAYVFEPNTKYIDEFTEAANQAKSAKIGVWEKDGYVTKRGFDQSVYD